MSGMGRLVLWLLAASLVWGSNCTRTTVGFTPFTDPFPAAYKGQPVSLYPNGNVRPAAHEKLGLQQAAQIVARDSAGNPDPNGKAVLLSVGMSNTTQEFTAFLALAQADTRKDPHVQAVDGAVSGRTAASIVSQPHTYWSAVEQRLQAAQATASQVQAIWLKEADANPNGSSRASRLPDRCVCQTLRRSRWRRCRWWNPDRGWGSPSCPTSSG